MDFISVCGMADYGRSDLIMDHVSQGPKFFTNIGTLTYEMGGTLESSGMVRKGEAVHLQIIDAGWLMRIKIY